MNDVLLEDLLRLCSHEDAAVHGPARDKLKKLVDAEAWHRVPQDLAGKKLTPDSRKVYMKVPPPAPQMLAEAVRITSDAEVNRGFSLLDAVLEANRCLNCTTRSCQIGKKKDGRLSGGCPVGLRIPEFIDAFRVGDIRTAYRILMEDNPLHRITARVCPQDTQCQEACALSKIGPVSIGLLERIVGDLHEKFYGKTREKPAAVDTSRDFPVAIIGSGPAGLTAAIFLARRGYRRIYMFEAFHRPAGVLRYGIPAFRLPREVIDEVIDYVQGLGVHIISDVVVGRTLTVDDLRRMGFKAIFLGTGAGLPLFMGIPGEELNGVISANEFLTRCNLMSAYREDFDTPIHVGKKIMVIGGGNVAMDAARWARRLAVQQHGEGARVMLLYRRLEKDMPARSEEIAHAREEGIEFVFLTSPVAFLEGERKGWVGRVRCQKLFATGEHDKDGRSVVKRVEGDDAFLFMDDVDMVIEALGTRPNALLADQNKGLEQADGKVVAKDPASGRTTLDGVFVGGDAARGGATVILAMGDGKKAAEGMHTYLQGLKEDAGRIAVDSRLDRVSEWFMVRATKILGQGKTKDGHAYSLREMVVYAPLIAQRARPGQFVILMIDRQGERIPLTLADWDAAAGTITLVFQEIGASTYRLGRLWSGDKLFSILGPLGRPSEIEAVDRKQTVVFVGGGVGIAPVYPIAKAHHALGNRVIAIIGARNEPLMFWDKEMGAVSDELYKTFDDKGAFVTHALERLLRDDAKRPLIAQIVAIGPVVMMENVYKTTLRVCKELDALPPPVIVSLNPTMMDGTGMCGGCRILIKGVPRYGCVDGPEFDASWVDFEALKRRQTMYVPQERKALAEHFSRSSCSKRPSS